MVTSKLQVGPSWAAVGPTMEGPAPPNPPPVVVPIAPPRAGARRATLVGGPSVTPWNAKVIDGDVEVAGGAVLGGGGTDHGGTGATESATGGGTDSATSGWGAARHPRGGAFGDSVEREGHRW